MLRVSWPRTGSRSPLFGLSSLALLAGLLPSLGSEAHALPHDGTALAPGLELLTEPEVYSFLTHLAFLSDGGYFLAEKGGRVRYHDGSALQFAPVLDIRDEVNQTGDRGLLSIALHPGFVPDGGPSSWIYLAYYVSAIQGSDPPFGQDDLYSFGRLTRYQVDTVNGKLLATLGSRHVLLGTQLPGGHTPDGLANLHSSHTAGTLLFGDDGSLLLSCGDGAHWDLTDTGGFDPGGFVDVVNPLTGLSGPYGLELDSGAFRSVDLRALAGKVLRLDPHTGLGLASNPFFDGNPASMASRAYALGLRNPYTMSLRAGSGAADPALGQPGELWLGDVGWGDWEELNSVVSGGEDFRWPCFEGPAPQTDYSLFVRAPEPFGLPDCSTPSPGTPTLPALALHHSDPTLMSPGGLHFDVAGLPTSGLDMRCILTGPFLDAGAWPSWMQGRLVIADYTDGELALASTTPSGQVSELRSAIHDGPLPTSFALHPLTGELWIVAKGEPFQSRLHRLRFAQNATPTAQFSATPAQGASPLLVQFDASASSDPEQQPLSYAWDFGDGSPAGSGPTPTHTYTQTGVYTARLEVADPGGALGVAETQVLVDESVPWATILVPASGIAVESDTEIGVSGLGGDLEDANVALEWALTLIHEEHEHPDAALLSGAVGLLRLPGHGEEQELFYYRLDLTATDSAGLVGVDSSWLYPSEMLHDVTGRATPIAKVLELLPAGPSGAGNPDIEVVRDGVQPAAGGSDLAQQFDTRHGGLQGDDDWVGLELDAPPAAAERFVALRFQEGVHALDGGWFEDFAVEVRREGEWEPVDELRVTPPYPFAAAATPGFDGQSYDTYELSFAPAEGDAIRLRGTPGGSAGFVSVGELRATLLRAPAHEDVADITAAGTPIARVFELDPPGPQGQGNPDPETWRNGTLPKQGSSSSFAQFDSEHGGDQGADDWVGYSFPTQRTLVGVDYQEGAHAPAGGWFATLAVEVQALPGAPWTPLPNFSALPHLPSDTSSAGSYEEAQLRFAPVLASGVRLRGVPGGSLGYVSVGELRVLEPHLGQGCGWSSYGPGASGANSLSLSSLTPPGLGLPANLDVSGAPGPAPAWIAVALAPSALPLLGGTLLVDPFGAVLLSAPLGASGATQLFTPLPLNAGLDGATVYCQAIALALDLPQGVRFSNGLAGTLCDW